ncbi:hypothetical protein [Flavobacterium chungangense]|uniref:Transcriptional regulator n=1 Tax=Flavobacterium chungangense TaxID=554283 RepID=A0A6V6YZK8_9FLAO|nr:hypothetical protein [Flavobacterium chungangense]CAD0004749.1 transcriptional regulator [Flavobacterium chungangense]
MSHKNNPTKINAIEYLPNYMDDQRLNIWHLAILTAILGLGYKQGQGRRIKVSRRKIMKLSHVNTLQTYHKYFKQLQDLGYLKYKPSYHPSCKSEVKLCKKRLCQND